ncbi:PadR family transcriptional regulator [Desulfococcaceae bacterium HSG8]|nr:PadR family transcriptional regulator [Desulfococcaceae bacterium HSG8]
MAKNELVSLALISNGPLHAYGLNRIVKAMDLENMAKISPASVYSALSRLKNEGSVEVSTMQVGNMPERKVYTITEKGKTRLEEEFTKAVLSTDTGENPVNIAINFAFGMPADEIISLLKIRIENLRENIRISEKRIGEIKSCGMLPTIISLNADIKHREVEIGLAYEFIGLLEKDPLFYERQGREFMECLNQDLCI